MGCSTHIYSSNKIETKLQEDSQHKNDITLVLNKDFYFYGLIPRRHNLDLSLEAQKLRVKNLSSIKVYERWTFANLIWNVATFGFYNPTQFIVEAKTDRVNP